MRTNLGLIITALAASIAMPAVFAQTSAAPRAHGTMAPSPQLPQESPFLGIGGRDVTSESARALKLKEERGVEVTSVQPGTAAAAAGLKEGDVLLEFNGQKLEGWEQLKRLVYETPIHRDVKLVIWRNGSAQTLNVTMGSHRQTMTDMEGGTVTVPAPPVRPVPPIAPAPPTPFLEIPQFSMLTSTSILGITGEPLGQESQLADFFGVKSGVLVRSVNKDSAAEKAGLKAGDVITKVDDSNISNPTQLSGALRAARTRRSCTMTVVRNKKEMSVTVTLEQGGSYRGGLWSPVNGWFQLQLPSDDGVVEFTKKGVAKILWQ